MKGDGEKEDVDSEDKEGEDDDNKLHGLVFAIALFRVARCTCELVLWDGVRRTLVRASRRVQECVGLRGSRPVEI